MKPFSLSVLLLLSTLAVQAEVVLVTGTIYDVGKGAYSQAGSVPKGDNLHCWVATASNLLQHWQDEYLPDDRTDVPDGYATTIYTQPSGTRYLNIYNDISANSPNIRNDLNAAITWYGNGTMGWDDASQSYVTVSGGYLRDYGLQAKQWVWGTGYSNSFHSMAEFKNLLDTAFKYNGYGVFLSMEVDHNTNSGHAITCWGYEADDSGNVTALYVTDSDDHQFGARRVEVTTAADGGLSFSSEYNNFSGTETNYINGVSYITSVRATNARTDNTQLPDDGVLTGAVNISGESIVSSTGISEEAGSILAAAGDKTVLTLGPTAGSAEGSGLVVKVGAMLTLDNTDVTISRFSGNGLSVAAEAGVRNGSVSITDNGGHGVCVQGSESDVVTFLQMSGNSVVESSRNGGDGIYVEGRMLLQDNRSVTLSDNDGAGILVKGSPATQSKYTNGLSSFDIALNDEIDITGNKQGGVHASSSSSNGLLYKGEVAFTDNGIVRLQGNEIEGQGGAVLAEGGVSFSGNTEVDISGNKAKGGTGACGGGIASSRYGSVTLSKNGTVSLTGNSSTGKGGAIYTCSNVDITGNTKSVDITGNTAVDGAAVYANTDVISGYIYQSKVSIDHNAAVNIKDNVSSGSNIIYNHGTTLSISHNGTVEISGNNAGSGSVIHNDWTNLQAASGGYYSAQINSVIEIAHNSSVTFSGNTAQYDVYNRNIAYISADEGQTITFQHGFKNAPASTAWPATAGGTTYLGKDVAGNTSEGGKYVFADNGGAVTLETAVATVKADGGMVFDGSTLEISKTEFASTDIKFTMEASSLKLSDVTFTSEAVMTVDFGYFADKNTITMDAATRNGASNVGLSLLIDLVDAKTTQKTAAVPTPAISTGLETQVFSGRQNGTVIYLSDYLGENVDLSNFTLSLLVDGWTGEGSELAIDTCGYTITEAVVWADAYVYDRTEGDIIYYYGKAEELIPEPVTATLSLLALAGLAARRRRRK